MTPSSSSTSVSSSQSPLEQIYGDDSSKINSLDHKIDKKKGAILAKLDFASRELPFDVMLKKSESKSEPSLTCSPSSPRITVSPRRDENASSATLSPSYLKPNNSSITKSSSAPSVSTIKNLPNPIHIIYEESDTEEN